MVWLLNLSCFIVERSQVFNLRAAEKDCSLVALVAGFTRTRRITSNVRFRTQSNSIELFRSIEFDGDRPSNEIELKKIRIEQNRTFDFRTQSNERVRLSSVIERTSDFPGLSLPQT